MNGLLQKLLPLRYMYFHPKYRRFMGDFKEFVRLSKNLPRRFEVDWKNRYPCLDDNTAATVFDAHYIYHPAWAARIIAETKPSLHIDVSSSLDFCAMISAFVPVEFYDIRPVELALSGLTCKRGDLLALPFAAESVTSLSCMHVVEHVGLGRYGDAIDPLGDLKAIGELTRVLAKGGSLLFVVPVGKPSVRFNAHRIYCYEQVMSAFRSLHVERFALVDDDGKFTENARGPDADAQAYGCGCWWFKK